jgi:hypothetical protein
VKFTFQLADFESIGAIGKGSFATLPGMKSKARRKICAMK